MIRVAPDNLKLEVAKNAIASVTTQDNRFRSSPSATLRLSTIWTRETEHMKKNLKNKIALIIAVLLICLYGIFGIPSGVSGKALLSAMTKRIHWASICRAART